MTHRIFGGRSVSGKIHRARAAGDHAVPQQQSSREAISDGVITAKVRAALATDPITATYEIHVETLSGVVRLTGFVETTSIRIEASRLAKYVDGVRQVDDLLDCRHDD